MITLPPPLESRVRDIVRISSVVRRAALGGLLVISGTASASAQRSETASRPTWLPQYAADLGDHMTPAERAEAMATVDEIERILWQTPELSHPKGFEVSKQVWGGGLFQGERGVFTYYFWLWFHAPSKRATGGEGSRCIGVTVNGGGKGYFIEREVGGGRAAPAKSGLNLEPASPDDPTARRVLTLDPEFWRVRRSRVEVRSLTLDFSPTQMCENSHVHAAVEKAYNGGINWAALKRLVDRP